MINAAFWLGTWLAVASWAGSFDDIPRLIGNALVPLLGGLLIDWWLRTRAADTPPAPDADRADDGADDDAKTVMLVQFKCEWAKSRFDEFAETADEYDQSHHPR